jgi:two-component system chemotaxis response regulator CheB
MNSEDHVRPVRVLVVDDSAFMRTALKRMIESDPSTRVVDTAQTGADALDKIHLLHPDVVTLDIEMPGMSGLEVLKRTMQENPLPVIMVSSLTQDGAEITLECLSQGAFDYVPKQLSYVSLDIIKIQEDLIAKIKAAAQSKLRAVPKPLPPPRSGSSCVLPLATRGAIPSVVAIGTSTGGPRALQTILPMLPPDLGVPVLIVQHMPVGFTAPFAQRLNKLSRVQVREAAEGDALEPAVVYIAPAGWQMTVLRRTPSKVVVHLSHQPEHRLHVPAVDVMMASVAQIYRDSCMGVIMTGMGSDGLHGMQAISREGGLTVGQDEASCTVYGMPRCCAEAGILNHVTGLTNLPEVILSATRYGGSSLPPAH